MKTLFRALIILLISAVYTLSHATTAPGDIEAVAIGDTSVKLDWQDIPDALGYYLYYGEESGIGGDYEVEGIDLIEESDFELTSLEPNTRYFIAITAVDDTGSESEKSPELEFVTLSQGSEAQAVDLRIIKATAVDATSIEMVFSIDMETGAGAQRQFIIENVSSGEELGVDISDVIPGKPQNILALLDGDLQENTQYKITVLDIRDKEGNTIESGIDAFVNFTTPSTFEVETLDLQSAGVQENEDIDDTNQITDIPDSPAVVEPNQTTDTNELELNETETSFNSGGDNVTNAGTRLEGNNAGTLVSTDEIQGNTLDTAANNEKLPNTGPEHWILLLVTVMLSTGVFYKLRK